MRIASPPSLANQVRSEDHRLFLEVTRTAKNNGRPSAAEARSWSQNSSSEASIPMMPAVAATIPEPMTNG